MHKKERYADASGLTNSFWRGMKLKKHIHEAKKHIHKCTKRNAMLMQVA